MVKLVVSLICTGSPPGPCLIYTDEFVLTNPFILENHCHCAYLLLPQSAHRQLPMQQMPSTSSISRAMSIFLVVYKLPNLAAYHHFSALKRYHDYKTIEILASKNPYIQAIMGKISLSPSKSHHFWPTINYYSPRSVIQNSNGVPLYGWRGSSGIKCPMRTRKTSF